MNTIKGNLYFELTLFCWAEKARRRRDDQHIFVIAFGYWRENKVFFALFNKLLSFVCLLFAVVVSTLSFSICDARGKLIKNLLSETAREQRRKKVSGKQWRRLSVDFFFLRASIFVAYKLLLFSLRLLAVVDGKNVWQNEFVLMNDVDCWAITKFSCEILLLCLCWFLFKCFLFCFVFVWVFCCVFSFRPTALHRPLLIWIIYSLYDISVV